MDIPKKPVSNLSSALASIHLTNQQLNNRTQSPNHGNQNNSGSTVPSDIEDIDISNNSTSNASTKPSLSNFDKYPNYMHPSIHNHNHDDVVPRPVITAPINLPQTQRRQSQNEGQSQHNQDHRNQFFTQDAMDFCMIPQNEEPPLDRIGLYIKNPPSEGISLFSHRVCHYGLFYICFHQ